MRRQQRYIPPGPLGPVICTVAAMAEDNADAQFPPVFLIRKGAERGGEDLPLVVYSVVILQFGGGEA